MTAPLLAFLIKLPLALAVFLVIAYAGTTSTRIAGVLFTFPILNGIAVIASPDPIAVAAAIYPLVIFNCVLFALVMTFPDALPPVHALSSNARLFARVITWSAAWIVGAYLITDFHAALPGASVLFAGGFVFAIVFMAFFWTKTIAAPEAASSSPHWHRFRAFWGNRTGAARIAFFVLAYACLFWVSREALDEKWVGMASALPLPGFFALATLMNHAEDNVRTLKGDTTLGAIRDTLFLGPLLVIPFNWTLARTMAVVPDHMLTRNLLLFALWALAASAVLFAVPRIAAYLDRRARSPA